jgi:small-conductance mechanosensitive channel
VPARADELLRRVDGARPGPATEWSLEKIEKALPELTRDLDASLKDAADAVARLASPTDLQDLQNELTSLAAPLRGWKDELSAEAKRVAEALDLIGRGKRIWSETERRPETTAAGEVVVHRVGSSIRALNEAEESLRTWGARVLAANDSVISHLAAVDATLERLGAAIPHGREHLLTADRPALWARGVGARSKQAAARSGTGAPRIRRKLGRLRRDPRPLLVQALLAVLLMLGLGRFSSRARERLAGESGASRGARLLEPSRSDCCSPPSRSPVFHPLAPRRLTQLPALIALFPVARIVTHASERSSVAAFVGLFVLLFLDRVGSALEPLPTLARATFLLLLAVGAGLAFWVSRRAQEEGLAWLKRAATLAMLGLALALLAEVGGWTNLGTLIGRAIIAGAIAGLYVYAATLALAALLAYALASRAAGRSHLFSRNAALVQRRAERAVRWAGAGLWVYMVATALGIRSTAAGALAALLDVGVTVGELSLSLRGVLAFVLTLVVAFFLARVVTAVLEEDVYPRTQLPRGAPYAISTLLRYALYSLGLLFALAAAGVPLGQVSIMLGGLGIGLGLGLQDLVRNFAAGLTLLFERRVHVEDVLELPGRGIFGRVLSIGMRASVVRTLNGAEVVVPNADLISSAVTNWTLSDRLCRIEVPVSVASGSDPESVTAVLLDAARSVQHLLEEPASQVLFRASAGLARLRGTGLDRSGYGESLPVTSELGLAPPQPARGGIALP